MGVAIIIPDINFKDANIGKVTPAKEITVESMSIIEGTANRNKIPLSIQYSPFNATNKSVTWRSSNETIAVVDADGVVEVKQGALLSHVTITATLKSDNSITASKDLEVKYTKLISNIPFDTGLVTDTFECEEDLFYNSYPQWTLMLHSEYEEISNADAASDPERFVFFARNTPEIRFGIFSKFVEKSTNLIISKEGQNFVIPNLIHGKNDTYKFGDRKGNIAIRRDNNKYYITIDGSTWAHVTTVHGAELSRYLNISDGFLIGNGDSPNSYFNGKIHAKLIMSIDSSADSEVASFFETYKEKTQQTQEL